jgi:hypothetical protein
LKDAEGAWDVEWTKDAEVRVDKRTEARWKTGMIWSSEETGRAPEDYFFHFFPRVEIAELAQRWRQEQHVDVLRVPLLLRGVLRRVQARRPYLRCHESARLRVLLRARHQGLQPLELPRLRKDSYSLKYPTYIRLNTRLRVATVLHCRA